jgi:hypothetical protein
VLLRSPSPPVDRLVDALARDLGAILRLEAESSVRSILEESVLEARATEPMIPIPVLDLGDATNDAPGLQLVRVVRGPKRMSGDRPRR